jgi:hypothetical protein
MTSIDLILHYVKISLIILNILPILVLMLLTQAASGGTAVLPVIISPCLFHGTALSVFQTVNSPKKSLSTLPASEREQVLVNIAETIMRYLTEVGTKPEENSERA